MINVLSPSSRRLFILILAIFLFTSAQAASYERGDGTFTDTGRGLVWVADEAYSVSTGMSRGVVLSRAEALRVVDEMNRGAIENFGHGDWRLATTTELRRLYSESTTVPIGLQRLGTWLRSQEGAVPGRDWTTRDRSKALIYTWPVRSGVGGPLDFSAIVLFAIGNGDDDDSGIEISDNVQVLSGDLIVNEAAALVTGEDSFFAGNLSADDIEIGAGTTVAAPYSVSYNSLDNEGTILGTEIDSLTLPVFDEAPPFQSAPAGIQNVTFERE